MNVNYGNTGVVLLVITYLCYTIFLLRIVWRIMLIIRAAGTDNSFLRSSGSGLIALMKTIADILFLPRLFRINSALWFGEWIFHTAFIIVLLRHARFVIEPVPSWVSALQRPAIISAYVLPLSLLYIFVLKYVAEKRRYISSLNFSLVILLFLISVTGMMMKLIVRPDIVQIKYYMMNLLALRITPGPESMLFIIHLVLVLVFLLLVPTHIFAAPYTLFQSRKREQELKLVIHEK